ncbi:MAG: hypothetical protein BMS9Abin05_2339 [Rhodothermia bacterium]|nr:MAG: hypothetical protein BMS9Abin05_2339 [Rhodothermia bacterium]
MTRNGSNLSNIGAFDYEIRFTARGGKAVRLWDGGSSMPVPFELWNTGIQTPDDPSDDYRMIPAVCEAACGAGLEDSVFDIYGDHVISSSDNDPYTDWIYWYNPVDKSAGEWGYGAYFDNSDTLGAEVFSRMVLVLWNGGREFPYLAEMPEEGTVFRIEGGVFFAPILAAPTDQSSLPGSVVSFYWNGHQVDAYRIQVSQDPDFTTGIDESFVEIGHTLELTEVGTYYWRIQGAVGDWSDTWTFDVLSVSTSIDVLADAVDPFEFNLFENYPNPFKTTSSIRYSVPKASDVRIEVFNVLGERVRVLENARKSRGEHQVQFDGSAMASGVYFFRMKAGKFERTRKMVLIR